MTSKYLRLVGRQAAGNGGNIRAAYTMLAEYRPASVCGPGQWSRPASHSFLNISPFDLFAGSMERGAKEKNIKNDLRAG